MRAPLLLMGALCVVGCEAVSGLSELEFEPEPTTDEGCTPDPPETTCAAITCGSTSNNCGDPVDCPSTCGPIEVCEGGGVGPNVCGCTGAPNLIPDLPPECDAFVDGVSGNRYYRCGLASFDNARVRCQSFGTDLAVIATFEENQLIHQQLVASAGENGWIGLRDEDGCSSTDPCVLLWVDGTSYLDLFNGFGAGEPNNSGGGEHCAEMRQTDGGAWNDVPCSGEKFAICETTCPAF
jgi:Lectin C-type domain